MKLSIAVLAASVRGAENLVRPLVPWALGHGAAVVDLRRAAHVARLARGEAAAHPIEQALKASFTGRGARVDTVAVGGQPVPAPEPSSPAGLLNAAAPQLFVAYAEIREAAFTAEVRAWNEMLVGCANLVDHQVVFARPHLVAALEAGATRAQVLEGVACLIPVCGMGAWLTAAPLLRELIEVDDHVE